MSESTETPINLLKKPEPKELYFHIDTLYSIEYTTIDEAIEELQKLKARYMENGTWLRLEIWPTEEDEHGYREHGYELLGVRHQTPKELEDEKKDTEANKEYQLYRQLKEKFKNAPRTR